MCNPATKCQKARDPKTCTPQQIKECHGDVETHPCETEGCQEDVDPKTCSPEQIRKCHGDVKEHPCAKE